MDWDPFFLILKYHVVHSKTPTSSIIQVIVIHIYVFKFLHWTGKYAKYVSVIPNV